MRRTHRARGGTPDARLANFPGPTERGRRCHKAVRSSEAFVERIFYYRYLKAAKAGTAVHFTISIGDEEEGSLKTVPVQMLKDPDRELGSAGPYMLYPGQTTMIDCERESDPRAFFCEEHISNV